MRQRPDGILYVLTEEEDGALLKIEPSRVDYWENRTGKEIVFFKMLKSILSGKGQHEGEHDTIAL